jgi:hypothetical protein
VSRPLISRSYISGTDSIPARIEAGSRERDYALLPALPFVSSRSKTQNSLTLTFNALLAEFPG